MLRNVMQKLTKINWKTQLNSKRLFEDKHDSSYYYNSKYWRNLRNEYYREHPICEECLAKGIYTPTDDIHHKIPFLKGTTEQQRWQLLLDKNNLMSLCKEHHINKHFNNANNINLSYY